MLLSLRQNKTVYALSIIASVFFVVTLVSAATTISTNIVTEGTLAVTGASTLSSTLDVTGLSTLTSLKVGSSGTTLTQVLSGTCSLVSNTSIAATSTGTGTCVTTGSVAGDVVIVSLATTTTKLAAQYSVIGTVAGTDSTTVRLLNLTGTAAVPSATNGFGSSTQYWIVR